jgi:hypothetical protein
MFQGMNSPMVRRLEARYSHVTPDFYVIQKSDVDSSGKSQTFGIRTLQLPQGFSLLQRSFLSLHDLQATEDTH